MTFADIFRLFSTMDASLKDNLLFSSIWNIKSSAGRCERRKVYGDEIDEEEAKCQNVLYRLLKQLFFHNKTALVHCLYKIIKVDW